MRKVAFLNVILFLLLPLAFARGNNILYKSRETAVSAATQQDNYTISGVAVDGNGKTLSGASVFITNSKYATATDSTGSFRFINIGPGTYQVVVKMLGFEVFVQDITVRDKPVKLVARLIESNTLLNTVTIVAKKTQISEEDRKKYLTIFLKNFIGDTPNSWSCTLLNPEVLNFRMDIETHTLKVSANDFVIVKNNALGYKLKYLLRKFEFNMDNNSTQTDGLPYFEELKGTEAEAKKWEAARRQAYLSSNRHFFRAVMNGTAKAEGYTVYKFIKKVKYNKTELDLTPNTPLNIDSLFSNYDKNTKAYVVDNKKEQVQKNSDQDQQSGLFVVYNGASSLSEFYIYKANFFLNSPIIHNKNAQQSQVFLLADSLLVDRNGVASSPGRIVYSGYWGWLRMADLTPLDYFVEPVFKNNNVELNKNQPQLKNIIKAIDTVRKRLPIEKLYLQTDKPYYTLGDTLRFKAYVLNGDFLTPSLRSVDIPLMLTPLRQSKVTPLS